MSNVVQLHLQLMRLSYCGTYCVHTVHLRLTLELYAQFNIFFSLSIVVSRVNSKYSRLSSEVSTQFLI